MKRLKYLFIFTLIFGAASFACNQETVLPKNTGDDEDEDPVEIPPPSATNDGDSVNIDL